GRQPPPRPVPVLRSHRRRGLRDRRRPVPHPVRPPRLRDRRGRGHLPGAVPGVLGGPRRNGEAGQGADVTDSISESENPAIPSPTPEVSRPRTTRDWWPNQVDLTVLNKHSPRSNPMGEGFDY